jgi:hypothetical protein
MKPRNFDETKRTAVGKGLRGEFHRKTRWSACIKGLRGFRIRDLGIQGKFEDPGGRIELRGLRSKGMEERFLD